MPCTSGIFPVCVLLFLHYFSQHNTLKAHSIYSVCQNILSMSEYPFFIWGVILFLRLHDIPSQKHTTFCYPIHSWLDRWVTSQFCPLWMNTGVWASTEILRSTFWGIDAAAAVLRCVRVAHVNRCWPPSLQASSGGRPVQNFISSCYP